ILATLIASIVQSATGFGFALIVVPVYLIVLNSASAIQIVILISILMSLPLWIKLRNNMPDDFIKWVFIGCVIGFPVGIYLFLEMDLQIIKAAVAVFIIVISLQNAWNLFVVGNRKKIIESDRIPKSILSFMGFISGIFGAAMAMPGPTMMLFLSKTNLQINQIRAVMMAVFAFAYSGAALMQVVFVGIDSDAWLMTAYVLPGALLGVVIGHHLSKKINERLFKGLILIILVLTGIFMLLSL
ncbi:sulfite exporter TauE/SafE family protein, partial [Pseudemcibacter sp.]|uniref:sulfite exporter TauE/SafE family protein n=1 Tax=Pseudemcibacter sp. TaxID=2943293 RepID=UPI003F69C3C4